MIHHAQGFDDPLSSVPPEVTRVYGLVLNPMRGRTEEQRLLAVCDNKEELEAFWHSERVEPYLDGEWRRVYRKDGPLEWFNPPWSEGSTDWYGNGIVELRRDAWRRVA